jgi:cation:H+ antiporter
MEHKQKENGHPAEKKSNHSELQFSVVEPELKKHENIEYYFILIGLGIIGLCLGLGLENNKGNIIYNFVLITGSLFLLLGASNIVLEYAVRLAKSIGISELIIGLTIVSIGTSIPEIFTSIISAQKGVGGLAIGDIVGSYITQLSVLLGIVILIAPHTVKKSFLPHRKRDIGLMVLSMAILILCILDGVFTRFEAILCILLFFFYTAYLYIDAKKNPEKKEEQLYTIKEMEEDLGIHSPRNNNDLVDIDNNIIKNSSEPKIEPLNNKEQTLLNPNGKPTPQQVFLYIAIVIGGILLTYFGALNVVRGGVNIAHGFNVSEHVIGATIVGLGTAIPELTVSSIAMKKNKPDIAYGNFIGSNIVDPLFSAPLGALVQPIYLDQLAVVGLVHIMFPIALFIGLYLFTIFNRTNTTRRQGQIFALILICIYVLFIILSFRYG